jgi:hypothetical protein
LKITIPGGFVNERPLTDGTAFRYVPSMMLTRGVARTNISNLTNWWWFWG